jgi:putative endonuclease
MKYFCYLLECSDSSFYCGWTINLDKRTGCHNRGKGARYTRSRLPVKLVYYEEFSDRSSAMRRERKIQRFTHLKKQNLIQGFSHDRSTNPD